MVPESYLIIPEIILRAVVLPDPFGPIRPSTSPLWNERFSSESPILLPYFFDIFSASILFVVKECSRSYNSFQNYR
jgi:hypothetical protein